MTSGPLQVFLWFQAINKSLSDKKTCFSDKAKIVFSIKRWETCSLYIAGISSRTLFLYNTYLFHF